MFSGVFVKIPKDLLCEISELTVNQGDGTEFQEGTILKVDDRALVQVVNYDPDGDEFEEEFFLKNDMDGEGGDEEVDVDQEQELELEQEQELVEMDQEVQFETINASDYTTYVITSEKDVRIETEDVGEVEELEQEPGEIIGEILTEN